MPYCLLGLGLGIKLPYEDGRVEHACRLDSTIFRARHRSWEYGTMQAPSPEPSKCWRTEHKTAAEGAAQGGGLVILTIIIRWTKLYKVIGPKENKTIIFLNNLKTKKILQFAYPFTFAERQELIFERIKFCNCVQRDLTEFGQAMKRGPFYKCTRVISKVLPIKQLHTCLIHQARV